MGDTIILLVLAVIVVLSFLHAGKHFAGGGCCGSGNSTIRTKKTLSDPIIGKRYLYIDGMTCKNCQARVENALNHLGGVSCVVNLRKKCATVSLSVSVDDSVLKETVEKIGYTVTDIR